MEVKRPEEGTGAAGRRTYYSGDKLSSRVVLVGISCILLPQGFVDLDDTGIQFLQLHLEGRTMTLNHAVGIGTHE